MTTTAPQNAVLLQGCTLADIERCIERAIQARMQAFYESVREKPDKLVRRIEAAKRLGVSLPTIDKYAKFGLLHPTNVGGRVYYHEKEILNFHNNEAV